MQFLHYISYLLDDLVKDRVDNKKQRQEGLTHTVDKLQSFDNETFKILSSFIDEIKIHNTYPLLISDSLLQKRISYYHDFDIKVSTGSTLTEYAISGNYFDKFIKESGRIGFDIIEIGENSIDLDIDRKKKISDTILSNDLEFRWKIGKKDPRHQLGIDNTLLKVDDALNVGAKKVMLEANEGISVGIYDQNGSVIWNYVAALTNKYPPNTFIFEAPLASEQSALIAEFGQRVNLAEVSIDNIASVESQRRGFLSKSSFGMSFTQKEIGGSPASKFIYYLIKTKHPVEQGDLINLTHLPRRTIQSAIEDLKKHGFIIERNSFDDNRRKVYFPVKSEWL
ncbi:MAG TPA: phosphosulfolactate synthase [Nitrososphaeraceae archaeon]